MKFAKNQDQPYSIQEIGRKAEIPMGESTGKVAPMIHYAKGMGLIKVENQGKMFLSLTPWGSAVLELDKYFKESITQWICHAFLCNGKEGALAWNWLYTENTLSYGAPFSLKSIPKYNENSRHYRIAINMYKDVFTENPPIEILKADQCIRKPIPLNHLFWRGIGALMLFNCEQLFTDQKQIPLSELLEKSRLDKILGRWDADFEVIVNKLISYKYFQVNNLRGNDIVLEPLVYSENVWIDIFD
jgi:hypothetical protein